MTGPGSVYLGRRLLLGMAAIFASCLLLIEVLNHVSTRDGGFASAERGNYYLWTFGPVFVLSMVAAFWGQVESQVQHSMPWLELKKGYKPADRNLLVNYVTPWSVVSLFKSLLAGHFPVSAAVMAGLLLKILIVVSTGLFVLQEEVVTSPIQARMVDRFSFVMAEDVQKNPVDPGFAFVAINEAQAALPPGVTSQYASSSFFPDVAGLPSNTLLSANVPVFAVEQNCTEFSWELNKVTAEREGFKLADIMAPNEVALLSPFVLLNGDDLDITSLPESNKLHYLNKTKLLDTSWENRQNLHIFTSIVRDLPGDTSSISALLCGFNYSITRRQVTTTLRDGSGGDVISISDDIIEYENLGISPSELMYYIIYDSLYNLREFYFPDLNTENWMTRFMNFSTPQPSWEAFTNTTLLSASFQHAFSELAMLVAKYWRTEAAPKGQLVTAIATTNRPRLVVSPVALRIADALLGLLIILALFLSFSKLDRLGRHRGSLMQTAEILARSSRLAEILSASKFQGMRELEASLRGYLFSSKCGGYTTIRVQEHAVGYENDKRGATELPETPGLWVPAAATTSFRATIVVITVAIFAALDAVYQRSRRDNGLAEVSLDGYTRYAWLFLPTLIMSSIGLSYQAMDSASRTLHPYLTLSRQRHPHLTLSQHRKDTVNAMEANHRAHISVVELVHALSRRAFGLSVIVLTSILGTLITVASSGLYTTQEVVVTQSFRAAASTWIDVGEFTATLPEPALKIQYDTSELGPPLDDVFSQAIQYQNMSYPVGTYQGFAFATVDLDSPGVRAQIPGSSGKLTARVPAVRGRVNCSVHEERALERNSTGSGTLSFNITMRQGCSRDHPGLDPTLGLDMPTPFGSFGFRPGPFGYMVWQLIRPGTNNSAGSFFLPRADRVCDDDNGAYHVFFVYGDLLENGDSKDVVILHCMPYMEAVDVEATFLLPSFEVDTTRPVMMPGSPNRTIAPDPSFDGLLPNRTIATNTSFSNLLPHPWPAPNNSIPLEVFRPRFKLATELDLPPFRELIQPNNTNLMINSINALSGELFAQTLNAKLRRPFPATNPAAFAVGPRPFAMEGRVEATKLVLVQSELSTRLLEVLLLLMAVCAVVSFWLDGMGERVRVLPVDPGSVAARMALLGGSELVERLQRGQEVEGERFGMGWWGDGEGKRYGIDVLSEASSCTGMPRPGRMERHLASTSRPWRRTPSDISAFG
ncbi:hypothetical protein QBC34DRAFT_361001 [Podospora aff. communis PSN243]|uniref:Uncharacterized protein n=1 Tax=Podospora aff. communis PSN243 TaxID=3040156 RepID=A0AAV9G7C1_9PEZI|nr:hypothetical protein QBC34DRAFT_361001 [Podospora aff. communis PSN243]